MAMTHCSLGLAVAGFGHLFMVQGGILVFA
ncbi:hypothetical protein BCL93_10197 [Onishia taeanensis]|uniref:Uncharacterized protein n=1 Tax=Onishia taeanensis TaxID=284577 RepID=A0A328XWC8_9GAMM|nr:hypothetical protein BCL93_10197 [Halomonas taeanensis]